LQSECKIAQHAQRVLHPDFLRAVSARSAQLLDLTDLARELGVAVNTAKAWLSVLQASYQVDGWDPFAVADAPLEQIRDEYGIPPLA
jgi:hypothetical protein